MGTITSFEEIQGWQKARELCKLIYNATRNEPFSRDWGLKDQLRCAAVSIVSNIAEGFESQNNRTFIRYLYIAKASCGELRAQAYVALDQGYITRSEFDTIYDGTTEIGKILGGLIT